MKQQVTVSDVHWFLDLFDELEITVWIDGGWGVDALLGECTRSHEDLDIIVPEADSAKLTQTLLERGFRHVHTDDRTDSNFVMGHSTHGLIDFHVIELAEDGGGVCGPKEIGWVISASELHAEGSIGGRSVRCLSPGYQLRSHAGYTLNETDFADVDALHQRFGVALLRADQTR